MDLQDGDLLFSTIREAIQLQETEQRHAASMTTARDMMMREFAKKLRDAQQILENTLEEHEEHRVRSSKRARESLGTSIDITELVSYAHKISYTSRVRIRTDTAKRSSAPGPTRRTNPGFTALSSNTHGHRYT